MGRTSPPEKVQLFCGAIYSPDADMERAKADLEAAFGQIDFSSEVFDFNFTEYYFGEMGGGLKKIFFAFENLIEQDFLSEAKLTTNEIEEMHTKLSEAGAAQFRTVNLDPGYLSSAKVVLPTTKDNCHRIYLKDGIYAEITLSYTKPTFKPMRWTYPDYATPEYISFFNELRARYRKKFQNA
jgi:hypothetical protein